MPAFGNQRPPQPFTQLDRTTVLYALNRSFTEPEHGIKLANSVLIRRGVTWDQVLVKLPPQAVIPAQQEGPASRWFNRVNARDVFNHILSKLEEDSARGFIRSLEGQWARRGFLTEKQCSALQKFHTNVDRPRYSNPWGGGDEDDFDYDMDFDPFDP